MRRLLETELPPETEHRRARRRRRVLAQVRPAARRGGVHAEAARVRWRTQRGRIQRLQRIRRRRLPRGWARAFRPDVAARARAVRGAVRARGVRTRPADDSAAGREHPGREVRVRSVRVRGAGDGGGRVAVRGTRYADATGVGVHLDVAQPRRPAWGGGGGSRRLEDSESAKARKLSRRGTHHPGGFDATSRSAETALSGKERARVAASRARAELATVERLRAARELRESRQSAPGGVASARVASRRRPHWRLGRARRRRAAATRSEARRFGRPRRRTRRGRLRATRATVCTAAASSSGRSASASARASSSASPRRRSATSRFRATSRAAWAASSHRARSG